MCEATFPYTVLTKSDLFAGVWRQEEGKQRQTGYGRSRHDQVEVVVERATSQQNAERQVRVRLNATLVIPHVAYRRSLCSHGHTHTDTHAQYRGDRKWLLKFLFPPIPKRTITTASIPTKFCTVIKTTIFPWWVVRTRALEIQYGGRPPSWKKRKSPYLNSGLTDRHEIW